MKKHIKYRYSAITILVIISLVFVLTRCINGGKSEPGVIRNSKGQKFAGSAKCANCHKDIYDHHIKTAHYLTSRIASVDYIKGSFEPGKNSYAYDFSSVVSMEKRAGSFFQVEYDS